MLIGRLTRDPEIKEFGWGKVANIGFAVNKRQKNKDTGQWEEVPVWLDLKAFSSEKGRKLADFAQNYLKKGSQVFVEGHLVLEQWEAKDGGGKRSKLVINVDDFQFVGGKRDEAAGAPMGGGSSAKSEAADLEEVPF
jgi:single-strand DNA-binding protein